MLFGKKQKFYARRINDSGDFKKKPARPLFQDSGELILFEEVPSNRERGNRRGKTPDTDCPDRIGMSEEDEKTFFLSVHENSSDSSTSLLV